ncbi:hypothetical protein MNBD_GAMMA21-258 [hydrothermal vent metagenome]|uniref:Sulfurtransferase n=1 Tax=hydrothermal vent metagenome TaxID=652676 RepID=A0A3B1AR66_9ZZZZ
MVDTMPIDETTEPSELLLGIHNDLEPWDQTVAFSFAIKEGIQLDEAHFEVLMYLRSCYSKFGIIRHARTLTQALEVRFATKGGLKYLYQLFPSGPVSQGCKLAGVPIPRGARDRSFGTVQ